MKELWPTLAAIIFVTAVWFGYPLFETAMAELPAEITFLFVGGILAATLVWAVSRPAFHRTELALIRERRTLRRDA